MRAIAFIDDGVAPAVDQHLRIDQAGQRRDGGALLEP